MNTKNIFNLIRRYFIESGRKDITTFVLIVLIITLFSFFSVSGSISDSLMVFLLFLMGVLYAARTFNIFQPAGRAIHYLTIPASNIEKTIANSFLVYIYYNILLIVALLLGNFLGGMAHKLLAPDYHYIFYIPFSLDNLILTLVFESIFLFGSIYFKQRAAIKTALVILAFFLFFIILDTTLVGGYFIHSNPESIKEAEDIFNNINGDLIEYTVSILAFVFFNFMTWLRLRETEA
jgi:hypothetical protein